MERVAFIVDATGERLRCMLNPESIVQRRRAGLVVRSSIGSALAANAFGDDVLLDGGGGMTVLELDLLFDVDLATGSSTSSDDVRALTAPIWALAERAAASTAQGSGIRTVRFVWGKSWNLRGVVSAVAERLEQFNAAGVPRRSWLRMRMIRTGDPNDPAKWSGAVDGNVPRQPRRPAEVPAAAFVRAQVHEVRGTVLPDGTSRAERLDAIALRYYGEPRYWRALASRNGLDDPTSLTVGTRLEIPPIDQLGAGST